MPLASWYGLHFYGSSMSAMVDTENPATTEAPLKKWQRVNLFADVSSTGILSSHIDTLRMAAMTSLVTTAQVGILATVTKKWQRMGCSIDVGAVPSAADAAFAVFSTQFYGRSFMDWQKIMVAALAGKSSEPTPGTRHFRDPADTKNVITATVVGGQRTAVTTNP